MLKKFLTSRSDVLESRVKALNLKDNYMTQESLRHIQMLLELNSNIVVEISEPDRFNWNHNMNEAEQ